MNRNSIDLRIGAILHTALVPLMVNRQLLKHQHVRVGTILVIRKHRIALFDVCNARHEFTLVDIGEAGRRSYCGVHRNNKLGFAINNSLVNRPDLTMMRCQMENKCFLT